MEELINTNPSSSSGNTEIHSSAIPMIYMPQEWLLQINKALLMLMEVFNQVVAGTETTCRKSNEKQCWWGLGITGIFRSCYYYYDKCFTFFMYSGWLATQFNPGSTSHYFCTRTKQSSCYLHSPSSFCQRFVQFQQVIWPANVGVVCERRCG